MASSSADPSTACPPESTVAANLPVEDPWALAVQIFYCPRCNAKTLTKRPGKFGWFLGCLKHPVCKTAINVGNPENFHRMLRKALTGSGDPLPEVIFEMESGETFRVFCKPGKDSEALLQELLASLDREGIQAEHTRARGGGISEREGEGGWGFPVRGAVFLLEDYEEAVRVALEVCLQKNGMVRKIPENTFRFFKEQYKASRRSREETGETGENQGGNWLSEEACVQLMRERMPLGLQSRLFAFQKEGVLYSLQRGSRSLIADEMGLGKTLQAIALLATLRAFPALIVVPASMRSVWAEEVERWLSELFVPRDIRVIFGHNDRPASDENVAVIITSFHMCRQIKESLLKRPFRTVIIDESHKMRSVYGKPDSKLTQAVAELARKARHCVMLSGTPSVVKPFDMFAQMDTLRPGMLSTCKDRFASEYCDMKTTSFGHWQPSTCSRSWELHLLLKSAVMIRRLKSDVMGELPPLRRQIVPIALDRRALLRLLTRNSVVSFLRENEGGANSQASRSGVVEEGGDGLPGETDWMYDESERFHSEELSRLRRSLGLEEDEEEVGEWGGDLEEDSMTDIGYNPPPKTQKRKKKGPPSGRTQEEEQKARMSEGDMTDIGYNPPPKTEVGKRQPKQEMNGNRRGVKSAPLPAGASRKDGRGGSRCTQQHESASSRAAPSTASMRARGHSAASSGVFEKEGFREPNRSLSSPAFSDSAVPVRWWCRERATVKTSAESCAICKVMGGWDWVQDKMKGAPAGTKFVLFAHHRRVMDRLEELLATSEWKSSYIRVDGGTPPITRQALFRRFNAEPVSGSGSVSTRGDSPGPPSPTSASVCVSGGRGGVCRVALVSITACSLGVDLSGASVGFFFEMPLDAGWLQQAEARMHRRGQTQSVNTYFLAGRALQAGDAEEKSGSVRWQYGKRRVSEKVSGDGDERRERVSAKGAKTGRDTVTQSEPFVHAEERQKKPEEILQDALAAAQRSFNKELLKLGNFDGIAYQKLMRSAEAVADVTDGPAAVAAKDWGAEVYSTQVDVLPDTTAASMYPDDPDERWLCETQPQNDLFSFEECAEDAEIRQGVDDGEESTRVEFGFMDVEPERETIDFGDGGTGSASECAESPVTAPDGLWFEVSPYTTRVHVHLLPDGSKPAGVSYLPEELLGGREDEEVEGKGKVEGGQEREDLGLGGDREAVRGARAIREAAARFLKEWEVLTPYQRRCLRDRPSRPPLLEASLAAAEELNESKRGGGGACFVRFRRPQDEEDDARLPSECSWRTVSVYYSRLGRAVSFRQGVGAGGRGALCLECMRTLGGESAGQKNTEGEGEREKKVEEAAAAAAARMSARSASVSSSSVVLLETGRRQSRKRESTDSVMILEPPEAPSASFSLSSRGRRRSSRFFGESPSASPPRERRGSSLSVLRFDESEPEEYEERGMSIEEKEGAVPSAPVSVCNNPSWVEGGSPGCREGSGVKDGEGDGQAEVIVATEEDLFCSGACRAEFFAARSAGSIRRQLFQLEKGVCNKCGLDCHALVQALRGLRDVRERERLVLQRAPRFRFHRALLALLVRSPAEGRAWHADHIQPVSCGGGQCGLMNLQTLCTVCHQLKSVEEQKRRRLEREREREETKRAKESEKLRKRQAAAQAAADAKKRKRDEAAKKKLALNSDDEERGSSSDCTAAAAVRKRPAAPSSRSGGQGRKNGGNPAKKPKKDENAQGRGGNKGAPALKHGKQENGLRDQTGKVSSYFQRSSTAGTSRQKGPVVADFERESEGLFNAATRALRKPPGRAAARASAAAKGTGHAVQTGERGERVAKNRADKEGKDKNPSNEKDRDEPNSCRRSSRLASQPDSLVIIDSSDDGQGE
uniref:Helicase ATP-binding domain-containing protein n=1 Tax=Chromera velia CCMP2878 TaxID=1169474 RepID=A0A0G4FCQ1_9ALVE|eukprot:Cvel_16390.t1-p1 / transcript=Cvel_16390.t1 / gene=Cvel_16390 / organism=Chromera_velia_CCMP2878 / gene_product=DNA annealing helicase and endonuclease ZRANB3, putative / transcript_product=DNA annealing helicase and endonuclease ZRANB3, putative / location=Cvel_scaffold1261:10139-19081(-) / protein_length=1850 / sequence_SO=supercontig / SO=protein_coding / is_pseudo=false